MSATTVLSVSRVRSARKRTTLLAGLATALLAFPRDASSALQDSVHVVTFAPGESVGSKLMKAAHVRPSPAQIKWMERERNIFIHYGMNTFHGADWGTGKENPKDFAPTAQDPEQWARVVKEAGFSMSVPTAKHHDGFCLWNTATTNHSVKNATATADVIDALAKGSAKNGVDLGIYLSPWDMNQRDFGVWKTEAYNAFFVNQLKELLGGKYGTIGELWFDGASADIPIWQPGSQYRPNMWYDTVEALQPMAVIRLYDGFYYADEARWNGIKQGTSRLQWRGKEIRWCGNEGGVGRADEWSVQPVWARFFGSEQQNDDLGVESYYKDAVGAVWYQSEVNTSIANGNTPWFWHANSYSLKSLNDMKTLYYNSIGNNSNLLLNLLPDNRGLIPDDQIALLRKWNNWIDSTFTRNLARGATATATALNALPEAETHEADRIVDNKRHTYWTTRGSWNMGTSKATLLFELPSAQTFDHVMIKEYVYNGQRVAGWDLEYYDALSSSWKPLVTGKKVIGYKRICKFNQVTSSKVRLNITRSWDNPEISDFALYRTMSGIDTTKEDVGPIATRIDSRNSSGDAAKPRITVAERRLSIAPSQNSIRSIRILGMDGRTIPVDAMQVVRRGVRLSPGVYQLVIETTNTTPFRETIAIP
jgi:alpha-L-fucosidase